MIFDPGFKKTPPAHRGRKGLVTEYGRLAHIWVEQEERQKNAGVFTIFPFSTFYSFQDHRRCSGTTNMQGGGSSLPCQAPLETASTDSPEVYYLGDSESR